MLKMDLNNKTVTMTDRFMLPYCLIPLHPHALADTPGGVSRFYRKSVPFS